jgi:D-alanine transaminase
MPLEQASISVMDRGFLFGDGVYEVIPVYGGHLFRFSQHIARLQRSLTEIGITPFYSESQWRELCQQLLAENHSLDCSLYLQITRGVMEQRDHRFPTDPTPTVFARLSPLPAMQQRPSAKGIKLLSLEDIRWQRCDIKAITLLANCMARQAAENAGADEALFVRDGYAIEGSASNVFMVREGEILTAPKSNRILGGITRDLVLEIAQAHQMPVRETLVTLEELKQADEVWITSSTREIQPVWYIDNVAIAAAKTGPIWHQMIEYYMDFKQKLYRGEVE